MVKLNKKLRESIAIVSDLITLVQVFRYTREIGKETQALPRINLFITIMVGSKTETVPF